MSIKIIFIFFIFFQISKGFELTEIKTNENKITNLNEIINKNRTLLKFRKLLDNYMEKEPVLGSTFSMLIDLMTVIYKFIIINNYTNIEDPNIEECLYEGIIEQLQNTDMIETCIKASGKALNDFGNEFECEPILQSKVEYFSLHFFLENGETLRSKEDRIFFDFLDQHYFYIGLCIPKKCKGAVKYLLSSNKTLDLIYQKITIRNFSLFYKNDKFKEYESDKQQDFNNWQCSVIIYTFITLISLKMVVGIGRIIILEKGYEDYLIKKEHYRDGNSKNNSSIDESEKNKNNNVLFNEFNEESKLNEENKTANNIEKVNKETNLEGKKPTSSIFSMKINDNSSELSEIYNKNINGIFGANDSDLYNPFNDNMKKLPIFLKIIKAIDFFDNINILSYLSNKFYNSNNLNNLYLIRFVLMIMIIVYQIVYLQIDLPYRNFTNYTFYNHPFFVLIKFCINAPTFWITLDSVIIGYKIMSFMKKEINLSKNRRLSFLSTLKFLLLIIPKFFVFIFSFIYLHILSSNLTFQLCGENNVFSSYFYYNDFIQNKTFSIRETEFKISNILRFLIPFRLNYIDFLETVPNFWTEEKESCYNRKNTTTNDTNLTNFFQNSNDTNNTNNTYCENNTIYHRVEVSGYELPSPFLTNTNLFVNVYFNEFYLLIIMLFITYISYKLRNKIFDFIILSINIILFILPIFDLNKHQEKEVSTYTLRHVLGQNYTEKYTHYFINFFYFGFIIGVMKFYYDETKFNNNNNKNKYISQINLPFEFCKNLIIFINKLKFIFKRIILVF